MTAKKLVGIAFVATTALAVGAGVAAIVTSPFHPRDEGPSPRLESTVDIAAPCERVFTYLGDSSHAKQWSVFVSHITPLNTDVAADGAQGSIRRSFRQADEQGMHWDELFTIVEPARRRRLRIFNMVGGAAPHDNTLLTEQLYTPLPGGGCRLAFTVFFEQPPSTRDALTMKLVAHEVTRVFDRNIGNVKRLVEALPAR